jgi:2-keto-4-pentenoate hydratase
VSGPDAVRRWSGLITTARAEGRTLTPITDAARLTLDDAYAVQREGLARRLAAGERPAGWKIGYASQAMRAQMGVDRPNYGPLTDAMLLADGAVVDSGLLQPRVEPEVALVLGTDLPPGADADRVAGAVRSARCALEVVDSVWQDYRFRIEDNTADGSSAAYGVLGPELPAGTDLAALGVTLERDGIAAGTGRGADAMGHPLAALGWLAAELGRHGQHLRAGEVVLTGGLTAAVPLPPGARVTARFAGAFDVSVSRAPDRQHPAAPPEEDR